MGRSAFAAQMGLAFCDHAVACWMSAVLWVLEKDRIGEGSPDLEIFANYLQMHDDVKGYQVFTISEGKKMVVVSLGSSEKDKKLEVSDVKFSPKETIVTVKRKPAPTANEKNPYILIGLDKIEGDLIVQDETGDRFEETDYQQ